MNDKIKLIIGLLIVLLSSVLIFLFLTDSSDPQSIKDPYLAEGKRLSETHCATCHKYPDPDLLPWRTWRFETLGAMALFLGIDDSSSAGSVQDRHRNPHIPDNIYSSEPQVTQEEWQQIRNYYLQMAPEELPAGKKAKEITTDSLFFKARYSESRSDNSSSVTAVQFDPGNRLIYLSDSNERNSWCSTGILS